MMREARIARDHRLRLVSLTRYLPSCRNAKDWPLIAGMSLLALSAVFPLVFMISASFRSQHDWEASKIGWPTSASIEAFERAWVSANIGTYFVNSLIVTVVTIVLSVISASLAGFAFAKLRWPFRDAVYFFVLAWMAIPPMLLMVPIYVQMAQLHLINTYWSVILLYTALNLPFNCFLMTAFFRALPDELIEAAQLDGANIHLVFFKILLPLTKPALATLCIFNILYVWNEFAFALLLLQTDNVKTLTVGVLQMQGRFFHDYPAFMAGLLITSLPVVGAYRIFQRHLVRAIAAGAIK
jgi:ABC-type glycerol-3-phosphate transport system permease component